MGRYINWADVTARYVDFAKGFDATNADAAIVPHAEAEVDGRLAAKYTVPFTPAPYLVKDLCVDLAYYKATIKMESSKAILDSLEARFKAINDGTLVLTTSDGLVASATGGGWAANSYHSSTGMDSEVLWQVDTQSIQDLQTRRGQL